MATYAIGDIQGCFEDMCRLLDEIQFDASADRLWFTGDLVNKGPRSADVLRFVRGLGDSAVTVLGNHDLTLLAVHHGFISKQMLQTCGDVLRADDRDELMLWLRQQPLMHYDGVLKTAMVHAGLAPQWTLDDALACAAELEACVRGADHLRYFSSMFGDLPDRWTPELSGMDRLRFITNCLTRQRFCTADGRLDFSCSDSPRRAHRDHVPWFRVPGRKWQGTRVVFGHWAMLGVHAESDVYGLDSGCVYRGRLTALRLGPEPHYASVSCRGG